MTNLSGPNQSSIDGNGMEAIRGRIREGIAYHFIQVPNPMESVGPDRIVGGIVRSGGLSARFSPDRSDDSINAARNCGNFHPYPRNT